MGHPVRQMPFDAEANVNAAMIIDRERSDVLALWYWFKSSVHAFLGDDSDEENSEDESCSRGGAMSKQRPGREMRTISEMTGQSHEHEKILSPDQTPVARTPPSNKHLHEAEEF